MKKKKIEKLDILIEVVNHWKDDKDAVAIFSIQDKINEIIDVINKERE